MYERQKLYGNGSSEVIEPVLKELPELNVLKIEDSSNINAKNLLNNSRGLFVHIWGTWCAPCEKEMPEFLNYAKKLENSNVKFLLIAVNDEEVKIKKFLKRFPAIPSNVIFAIDQQNKVMDQLGTLKVPETFLFNQSGKHINKFVGPQDWMAESYITRLNFWLNNQKLEDRKIETH